MSAMPNPALLRLPTELLVLVVGYLDPWDPRSPEETSSDLCSLRLVSRQLNDVALPALAERYFRNRCVMLRKNSLENLVAISRHPAFGPAVMHLTIRFPHWTGFPQRANTSRRPQDRDVEEEDVEKTGADLHAYYRLMEEQLFMMESGLTTTYIVHALSALPALKTLSVDEQLTAWGTADLVRLAGLELNDMLKAHESIGFSRHAIRAIVLAIIVSNTSLDQLNLSPRLGSGHTISLDMLAFSLIDL